MSYSRIQLILSDGSVVTGFDSYRIRSDMRQMASSFILTLKPFDNKDAIDALIADPNVTIKVDGTSIIKGRVGQPDIGEGRQEGSYCNITGEDLLGIATKSNLPRGFSVANKSIKEAVESALDPWGLKVIASNDTNRDLITVRKVVRSVPAPLDVVPEDTIVRPGRPQITPEGGFNDYSTWERMNYWTGWTEQEVSHLQSVQRYKTVSVADKDERQLAPNPGENIGTWIARICEYYKLLCWLSAAGEVILTRPRYDQINMPVIRTGGPNVEGAVQRIEWSRKPIDGSTIIEVCGRCGHDGDTNTIGKAENTELIAANWHNYKLVVEESLHNPEEAQKKAERILHDEEVNNNQITCTISGHAIGPSLIAPDRMVHINWPLAEIDEDWYCIARDFIKSRDRGTVCDLTFVKTGLMT
jgi:prophage tail gpP-like protein